MVGQGEPHATLVICTQQGLDALSRRIRPDVIQAYRLVLRNPR
jgi:hypothetical protein